MYLLNSLNERHEMFTSSTVFAQAHLPIYYGYGWAILMPEKKNLFTFTVLFYNSFVLQSYITVLVWNRSERDLYRCTQI